MQRITISARIQKFIRNHLLIPKQCCSRTNRVNISISGNLINETLCSIWHNLDSLYNLKKPMEQCYF